MREIIIIVLSAVLVENFVLTQFLGVCPFIGVSKRINTALGMGGAVIFVMTFASAITKLVFDYLLEPNSLEYLNIIAFILVIASLVQFVEIVLKRFVPPLYKALGIYLPLITTNCAVLGMALMGIEREYSLGATVLFGLGAGLGFTLALVLFAGVREKLEENDIPESLKGFSISLIAAALVSVAFFGFQGLF
ncbi:RnfABCDGE type electron transport complex subunit A [Herbivorax sp. ANBcel31]|uniref:electron transport complex protein RnfA n=1 Tax=Herbivorax sp. ANBcel31 TaxID=3069754 RepID=UPI0027B07004|nr:RnfABCDGE type electron transport complex subunit A [Herbivorax sp. ANBcel31]MDQ2086563.1 RnfABCDGE type electron transport complex subunit A [Herbivorax sp. ANBcel31]